MTVEPGATPSKLTPPAFVLGRRPALDGLRALAVLGVFAAHTTPYVDYGGLGVDLFFVLSGFLITTLLMEESTRTGGIALKSFFARRARRLLPGFFLLVVGVMILVFPFLDSTHRHDLGVGLIGSVFYVRNWVQIATGKGVDGYAMPHLWSLAVEEQFYIVWPFVFALLRKRLKTVQMIMAVAVMLLISAVIPLFVTNLQHINLGTETRAAQVLCGVLIAMLLSTGLLRFRWPPHADLVLAAIIVVVLFAGGVLGDSFYQKVYLKGGLTVFAVICALCIAALMQDKTSLANRLLSFPPLTFFGRISYAFYLWHVPVNLVVGFAGTPLSYRLVPVDSFVVRVVVGFALSTAVAWASTELFERRFRSWFPWADQHAMRAADAAEVPPIVPVIRTR
jgi:peptidoglycan/LPS O-acetylase OafA/YrhL